MLLLVSALLLAWSHSWELAHLKTYLNRQLHSLMHLFLKRFYLMARNSPSGRTTPSLKLETMMQLSNGTKVTLVDSTQPSEVFQISLRQVMSSISTTQTGTNSLPTIKISTFHSHLATEKKFISVISRQPKRPRLLQMTLTASMKVES